MRRAELEALTKAEVLAIARKLDIGGRSTLSKDGLIAAILKVRPQKKKTKPFASKKKAATVKQTTVTKKTIKKKATTTRKTTKTAAAMVKKSKVTKKRPAAKPVDATPEPPPMPAFAPRVPTGAPLQMPERYDRDFVGLMARDPYWLHAYWEVTPKSIEKLERKLGAAWKDHRAVLRVYSTASDAAKRDDSYDIEIPTGACNWYINAGRPDRTYQVAVGVLTRRGEFHTLAESNKVSTPRDQISDVTDEEWMVPPETFARLYEMATPEAVRAGHSSADLGILLRERLFSDWSSGMLASMGSGEQAQRGLVRGFFFTLNAELIIYGATEPNAKVTVQGRSIQLRPDGTFSLRFQLPDGTQVIDATAISKDGVFRKTITPTVRRETSATEMIGSKLG